MGNRSTRVTPILPVDDPSSRGGAGKVASAGRGGKDKGRDDRRMLTQFGRIDARAERWFRHRNEATLQGSLAFVPWIIQQSFVDGTLDNADSVVTHRGDGAVVFSDASGFTALTERLALKSNGAELLCMCLTKFFTPLIDIIEAYRGDVIKFSGDALTIYFPAVDDTKHPRYKPAIPPHGTYGLPDVGPMATAVLRASACCVEIHKKLHNFDTGVDGVVLCLHIGVGCGNVTILQVGGELPPETKSERWEYVIAGAPLEQISIAEPLAKNGETCLSPQAWTHVEDCVVEGRKLEQRPDFHILMQMDESKYTYPTIRNAAMMRDERSKYKFSLGELHVLRRYIPSALFKQIEGGTLTYVNEMRQISTIFICGSGVDVSSDKGSKIAQELMTGVQRACYAHEGTLNKYLVDDKGMLFLLVFGLPPMVHTDDSVRAVLACMDMAEVFRRLGLVGRFGVTTGRNYCGVVGSAKRMEYTVLGDTVNLAARLMGNAKELSTLVDEATYLNSQKDIQYRTLTPITVKGKTALIPIFEPLPPKTPEPPGLRVDKSIAFPWTPVSVSLGGKSRLLELSNWDELKKVQHVLDKDEKGGGQHGLMSAALGGFTKKNHFTTGGILVISGDNGMGKTEMTEFVVGKLNKTFSAIPCFGTSGCRPGEKTRPVHEMLRSIIQALRHYEPSLPAKELDALAKLSGGECDEVVDFLRGEDDGTLRLPPEAKCHGSEYDQFVPQGIAMIQKLIRRLMRERPVCCVVSLRSGSNIFPSKRQQEDETVFWDVVHKLAELAKSHDNNANALMLVVVTRTVLDDFPATFKKLVTADHYVRLSPLSDQSVMEMMTKQLNVPQANLPTDLHRFVATITRGNALFIRETIDQLIAHSHVEVDQGSSSVTHTQDLESINIKEWANTAMVGNTICLLESLDPLPAAVVKMATVFQGIFTVGDLAASSCSRWSGAHYLNTFRVFYSVHQLLGKKILERADQNDDKDFLGEGVTIECFKLTSVLVRKVADAMVLEAQKKAIKRQALVERVLLKELPPRMAEVKRKKMIQHIPWYYQIDQVNAQSVRA